MKTLLYITLSLIVFSGCRRSIIEENPTLAMVPIKIDWSESGLNLDDVSRVTVRVFPKNGSPAYNFIMQSSKTNDVMPLALGRYSFVIFNETIDPSDWNSLVFKNPDNYDSFTVTTPDDIFKGLYTKAESDVIRKSPDNLAVFSIDDFEVTQEMINYTNLGAKGGVKHSSKNVIDAQLAKLTSIVPISVVKQFNLTVLVHNLISAKKSSGAIRGMAGAIQMSSRKPVGSTITHVFILNGRKYTDSSNPKDGTLQASITIFDPYKLENLKCDLMLDFLLVNESSVPTIVYDITESLKTQNSKINISVGSDDGIRGDRPITLPIIETAGGSVGMEDWTDIEVPMK